MNRIKSLREEKHITMKEAAKQLGLPYTTYVNYEKGYREPNSETLIDISNFYNTSIDYLLGKSNDRITEEVLDTVNEIDAKSLESNGNIRDALKSQKANPKLDNGIDGIYFSLAKEFQDSKIDPEDVKKALELIKKLRNE